MVKGKTIDRTQCKHTAYGSHDYVAHLLVSTAILQINCYGTYITTVLR